MECSPNNLKHVSPNKSRFEKRSKLPLKGET